MTISVDDLAQEIRRVDGGHDLGAGALAEALMPFIAARLREPAEAQAVAKEVYVRFLGVGEGGPYPVFNGVCVIPSIVARKLVASAVGEDMKREALSKWADAPPPSAPVGVPADILRIVDTAIDVCNDRDRPAMAEDLEAVRLYVEQASAALAATKEMQDYKAAIAYIFGEGTADGVDWNRVVREKLTPPWPTPEHIEAMGLTHKSIVVTLSTPVTDAGKVGCERDDGTLNIHSENVYCAICAPAGEAWKGDWASRLLVEEKGYDGRLFRQPSKAAPQPSAEAQAQAQGGGEVVAKPIEWQEDGPGEWCDRHHGFHITQDDEELQEDRFTAAWGECDPERFPTLDEAQAWCQEAIDRYIREWAITAPPSAPVGVRAAQEDRGEFCSDTAALAFLHLLGNGNPNVERAVERLRSSLITLAQQPAAVDGAYPTPRNRAEAVALARLALAYLGVIDAHIDAAIARCETIAAQPGGDA